jgi:hypothetical protein
MDQETSKIIVKTYTEKNYVVFGEHFFKYKIPGCRCYASGLVDKITGIKNPGFTIPADKLDEFKSQAVLKGIAVEYDFENHKLMPTEETVEIEDPMIAAFDCPKKKKKISEIKSLKKIESKKNPYSLEIVDVGNVRFNIYNSSKKVLIFFENYVGVISVIEDYVFPESVTIRKNDFTNIDEFVNKFILDMRNFDLQPYNFSQTEIGPTKFAYFYIRKYQNYTGKKNFIAQFLNGVDMFLFESDFLLDCL